MALVADVRIEGGGMDELWSLMDNNRVESWVTEY